jgi:hypothetical protein
MPYLVEITNKRQFKSTTGFDKATFTALLTSFILEYEVQNGGCIWNVVNLRNLIVGWHF